jgi:hypothetical protein
MSGGDQKESLGESSKTGRFTQAENPFTIHMDD